MMDYQFKTYEYGEESSTYGVFDSQRDALSHMFFVCKSEVEVLRSQFIAGDLQLAVTMNHEGARIFNVFTNEVIWSAVMDKVLPELPVLEDVEVLLVKQEASGYTPVLNVGVFTQYEKALLSILSHTRFYNVANYVINEYAKALRDGRVGIAKHGIFELLMSEGKIEYTDGDISVTYTLTVMALDPA